MKKDLLVDVVNLQRFAEEEENVENDQEDKIYSKEDFEKALELAKKEAIKGMISKEKVNEIVKARIAEEKRLASLSAEEKAKEQEKSTRDEIEKLKNQLRIKDLENDTKDALIEKKYTCRLC